MKHQSCANHTNKTICVKIVCFVHTYPICGKSVSMRTDSDTSQNHCLPEEKGVFIIRERT